MCSNVLTIRELTAAFTVKPRQNKYVFLLDCLHNKTKQDCYKQSCFLYFNYIYNRQYIIFYLKMHVKVKVTHTVYPVGGILISRAWVVS